MKDKAPSLAAAAFWLGVTLLLLPFALFCVLMAVVIAPKAAIIFGGVGAFTIGRKLYERRRSG